MSIYPGRNWKIGPYWCHGACIHAYACQIHKIAIALLNELCFIMIRVVLTEQWTILRFSVSRTTKGVMSRDFWG